MIIESQVKYSAGDYEVEFQVPNSENVQPLIDFYLAYRKRIRALDKDVDPLETTPKAEEIKAAVNAVRPLILSEINAPAGFSRELSLAIMAVELYNEIFALPEIKKK